MKEHISVILSVKQLQNILNKNLSFIWNVKYLQFVTHK